MAVKALIFGVDEIFEKLAPCYERAVQCGDIDIVDYAVLEQDGTKLHSAQGGGYRPS